MPIIFSTSPLLEIHPRVHVWIHPTGHKKSILWAGREKRTVRPMNQDFLSIAGHWSYLCIGQRISLPPLGIAFIKTTEICDAQRWLTVTKIPFPVIIFLSPRLGNGITVTGISWLSPRNERKDRSFLGGDEGSLVTRICVELLR